jgi:hypothetical protein
MADMANEWRAVVAALANPEMRRVVALLTLEQDAEAYLAGLSPSRRRHIVDGLRAAGLIDDQLALRDQVFAQLLAASAPVKPTGVQRFLRDGRLLHYPSNAADRAELFAFIAEQVLAPGEVVDEPTMNERLIGFTEDVAALRRYLVDAALVERSADGSEYARVIEG